MQIDTKTSQIYTYTTYAVTLYSMYVACYPSSNLSLNYKWNNFFDINKEIIKCFDDQVYIFYQSNFNLANYVCIIYMMPEINFEFFLFA